MRKKITTGILACGLALFSSVFAQTNSDEVTELKQRVSQLEKQVQEMSQIVEPLKAQQAIDNRRRALRQRFEKRMAQDRAKFPQEQLREAENLIRIADQQWDSPHGKESIETLITKYADFNRGGCAMLYKAQMSQGDERLKCLQLCIEKYNDCFYGDGVQVGIYARYLLADDYTRNGDQEKAAALFDEIKLNYADAIDHSGNLLLDRMKAGPR